MSGKIIAPIMKSDFSQTNQIITILLMYFASMFYVYDPYLKIFGYFILAIVYFASLIFIGFNWTSLIYAIKEIKFKQSEYIIPILGVLGIIIILFNSYSIIFVIKKIIERMKHTKSFDMGIGKKRQDSIFKYNTYFYISSLGLFLIACILLFAQPITPLLFGSMVALFVASFVTCMLNVKVTNSFNTLIHDSVNGKKPKSQNSSVKNVENQNIITYYYNSVLDFFNSPIN
jgi:hypothetical protein